MHHEKIEVYGDASSTPEYYPPEVLFRSDAYFSCKKCNHNFSLCEFHIAIILYGLIACQKQNEYLFGITCPYCFNTLLKKCDQAQFENLIIFIRTTKIVFEDCTYFPNRLSYYTTPLYLLLKTPTVNQIDLYFPEDKEKEFIYQIVRSEEYLKLQISQLTLKKPTLNDMYCTYVPMVGGIYAYFASVFWFKEKEINNILNIENENNLKILPRYFVKSELLEYSEKLAWKNRYSLEYFDFSSKYNRNPNKQLLDKRKSNYNFINLLLFDDSGHYSEFQFWYNNPLLSCTRPFFKKNRMSIKHIENNAFNNHNFA